MKLTQDSINKVSEIIIEIACDLKECGIYEWSSLDDAVRTTILNINHDLDKYTNNNKKVTK